MSVTASDNLANWSDNIGIYYRFLQPASDDLNSWSDLVATLNSIGKVFADSFSFSDSIRAIPGMSLREFEDVFLFTDDLKVRFHHSLSTSDINSLTDALNVTLKFLITNSDQIQQNDAVVVSQPTGALSISVGAQMTMGDSLGAGDTFKSDSFINYLRRYLGDVPR